MNLVLFHKYRMGLITCLSCTRKHYIYLLCFADFYLGINIFTYRQAARKGRFDHRQLFRWLEAAINKLSKH